LAKPTINRVMVSLQSDSVLREPLTLGMFEEWDISFPFDRRGLHHLWLLLRDGAVHDPG
jgi:hypothetical protein